MNKSSNKRPFGGHKPSGNPSNILQHIGELFVAGLDHQNAGRHTEAESCFREVLKFQPNNTDAMHLLGRSAMYLGNYDAAIEFIRKAIRQMGAVKGQAFEYYTDLGKALILAGKVEEAVSIYGKAVGLKPENAQAHYNLGTISVMAGRIAEAETSFRRAVQLAPSHAESWINLGIVLIRSGRPEEAIIAYHQAVAAKPDSAEAWYNFGDLLVTLGRFGEALPLLRRATEIRPDMAQALNDLGITLAATGQPEEAIEVFQRALAQSPDCPLTVSNLGNTLVKLGRFGEALPLLRRAIAMKPDMVQALNDLGVALDGTGQYKEAIEVFRHIGALTPDNAEAISNLAHILLKLGRTDEAESAFAQAVRANPGYHVAVSNLLMCLHYNPGVSNGDLAALARGFGQRFGVPRPAEAGPVAAQEKARLRVGYVSGDFYTHAVSFFLAGVLASHDHSQFEIFCYATNPATDGMTHRLREAADQWRDISALSDQDAAALIRRDNIDILVDLSGHTSRNRLILFSHRPAPVQITWLGYYGTTGLEAIDYILADRYVLPEGEEAYFTEAVWRLPDSYFCFEPPEPALPLTPPPAAEGRPLTFGCFNNLAKVSDDTLRLWGRLLARLPGSRLMLKTFGLQDAEVRTRFIDRFAALGIDGSRLILEGPSSRVDLLSAYGRVDIGLDPFPCGGGTTTAEALWMGIPVITLRGGRWVGRVSTSILTTIGLDELVAASEDAYLDIAASLSADLPRLAELRSGLRTRVENSALCDRQRFAGVLEQAYREMWQRRRRQADR